MRELEDLEALIAAATALVFIDSADHERLNELVARMARRDQRPVFRYSMAAGLTRISDGARLLRPGAGPADVLGQVLAQPVAGLYLMFDIAASLAEALVESQLRELALNHDHIPHTVLVVGSGLQIPPNLRTLAAQMEIAQPTAAELEALIHDEAAQYGQRRGQRVKATADAITALARALLGLTYADARRLVRVAVRDALIDEHDLPQVVTEKYKLLDQGGVLSFDFNTPGLDQVAGLTRMKTWLNQRREVFLATTPEPGIDPPKGMLLLGVQGAGKSLAAKSVAGAWAVPLLRLDFATLYNKYYGETERNLRESLRTAEVMAPCVLWIDEIEKGLASEGDDGGPGRRILGTLLTWMAERKAQVFLVATANDISALPPELLRKGRFDEIFFVDLPSAEVRQRIFEIHLGKRGVDPATVELAALVTAAEGFSGAEIEQAVVAGLYNAKARAEPLATGHVLDAITGTKPLSVVMAERIAALRLWAAERTVPAD